MSENKSQAELERKEQIFMKKMEIFSRIDKELQSLVKNYDEGLESIALMRFESPEVGERFSSTSFTVGPAFSIVDDTGKDAKLIRNTKNPLYLEEEIKLLEEENFDLGEDIKEEPAESFESFKKRMAKKDKNPKKPEIELKEVKGETIQTKEDDIYDRFGAYTIPSRIYPAKRSFDKVLDSVINLVNELRALHSVS